jgi:hypothetical protein
MSENKIIDNNLTPLSHEEAIKALKVGETLVNGIDNYDVAHYHFYQGCILKSDSYYDLAGEGNIIPEDDFPQLYRCGEGSFGGTGMGMYDNADKELKAIVDLLCDKNKYPLAVKQFGVEGLKVLLVTMVNDKGSTFTKESIENSISMIENSFQGK